MANVDEINIYIQERLKRQRLDQVPAVVAGRWLHDAGLLPDSGARPGLPIRSLLRTGQIEGAVQHPATPHGRWYIGPSKQRVAGRTHKNTPTKKRKSQRHRNPRRSANADEGVAARRRRDRAAQKYRPRDIELLLIAEAPPAALDRYFYFEDVREQDSLFRYVARSILHTEPTRANKTELLTRLRERGVFLIDLKRDPVNGKPLEREVPALVQRICKLEPRSIIVIKASVYDLVYPVLAEAHLPVIDERIPFPGSGQQRRFEAAFERALRRKPVIHC